MKHLSNAALRLDQRQRRYVDIETALCHRFVSVGIPPEHVVFFGRITHRFMYTN